jgi:hypothetical protein
VGPDGAEHAFWPVAGNAVDREVAAIEGAGLQPQLLTPLLLGGRIPAPLRIPHTRLTPLRLLYQSFRPRPAGAHWPRHAVWPEYGIPRTALIDSGQFQGPGLATPPVVSETIVDHGKIHISAHLTGGLSRARAGAG